MPAPYSACNPRCSPTRKPLYPNLAEISRCMNCISHYVTLSQALTVFYLLSVESFHTSCSITRLLCRREHRLEPAMYQHEIHRVGSCVRHQVTKLPSQLSIHTSSTDSSLSHDSCAGPSEACLGQHNSQGTGMQQSATAALPLRCDLAGFIY